MRLDLVFVACTVVLSSGVVVGQEKPYDVFPEAEPPYYRVRYAASTDPGPLNGPGQLKFAVNYTVWVPPGVETLRGVVVHQHGCGPGSCSSGLTGAFDLHWQALAREHDCALFAASYEQPDKADCQLWCDPRNGSSAAFQKALVDLGEQSGHSEMAIVPWALWGHSGGGHWCGGMTVMHPERVAAAWLRSGVPLLEPNPLRESIKPHDVPEAALAVPIMCNPGTKEGVTVKEGRFAGVWPVNKAFFSAVRGRGGLLGIAVDPLTAHECGNQRYMAIRWLDACLSARLPDAVDKPLNPMPTDDVWLAGLPETTAVPASKYDGDANNAVWLPNEEIATLWMQYVTDTNVGDMTPPPAPMNVRVQGDVLRWDATADVESGLSHFIIERNGEAIATVPEKPKNRFGRPLFQNLQYSDTPVQPLQKMEFADKPSPQSREHAYRVIAVNTVGLKSKAVAAE